MRIFRELSWSEGTEAITTLLSRLTAMRGILEKEPMRQLSAVCASVIEGNLRLAVDALFSMTNALLEGKYRRVTGDLFKDFLLHEIFLEPHPFALMASANRLDEALYNAMKDDLDLLLNFRELDGETLFRYIQERYHELRQRVSPQSDLSTRRAVAAWSGGPVRPPEEAMQPLPKLPLYLPSAEPKWAYGEEELRDSYVSDEALEEMYHRFLESEMDWSSLNEDLWNFFAAYGSGEFLRVRRFMWLSGKLMPIGETRLPREGEFSEEEYRSCLGRMIEFMRGESSEPIEFPDAPNSAVLFTVADELPELRLVCLPEKESAAELASLFDILRDQPLKFAVVCSGPFPKGFAERLVPANVLTISAGE